MALDYFHSVIANWFTNRFGQPTDVQRESWKTIQSRVHTLIAAPTGSGKTLAAFLSCIDRLFKQGIAGDLPNHTHVLYVSPLKALGNDIQINLRQPLAEIMQESISAGYLCPEIQVAVRTGDTPAKYRHLLIQHPPHILITTPESLFLLLTARRSREILRTVHTVIIDEIHALAPNKRGAHLALSLERLEALTHTPPCRIGLSATQRPIQLIANFLVGQREEHVPHRHGVSITSPCHIVNLGQHRPMDLIVEVPKDELSAVASLAIWSDIYDRVTELVLEHRSTLVFVNTRRLAERMAHHLSERLGEELVATHHGSLSRPIRLATEARLKNGQTRVVVATASLELGIDIGTIDLVCQIGSPRSIATCLQRIGRAGHWIGAIPKGRLFCTTRDELIECAALVRSIRRGNLDVVFIPVHPLDILAQQIVGEVASQEWPVEDLFRLCQKAYPYRSLTRTQFDEIIHMVAEGFIPNRGRQQAFLFHDRLRQRLRPRRGARLAALTSGGAIPDTATFAVIADPHNTVVGTVDEDFAVESLAGDIILLGNTSWRIRKVEIGSIRVEDAHGAPPNIPFWRGEAPSRTFELSQEVADLRQDLSEQLPSNHQHPPPEEPSSIMTRHRIPASSLAPLLQNECSVDHHGADQILEYLRRGHQALRAVPTQQTVIAERFFDEAGGMQLVIHAPFGGRINRAWGLALRKRFCVNFDFELQAAATDEGLVLSLGEKHSFPLESIFHMLQAHSVKEVLIQAVLASPMFIARWRWNASRALALLRFRQGKRVPLHIQRMRAEDLLTAIFPMATACQDNHHGDIAIPAHPLVQETIRDCLEEAMDVEGLIQLLTRLENGTVRYRTVESPVPSCFSHEILNANPYAFLDDAPLEERRSRAVNMRHLLRPEDLSTLGALAPHAIHAVTEEAWPVVRNTDDLQDVLHILRWVPETTMQSWQEFLPPLKERGQAVEITVTSHQTGLPLVRGWVTPDHVSLCTAAFQGSRLTCELAIDQCTHNRESNVDPHMAILQILSGWMECLGPTTVHELADTLYLNPSSIQTGLYQLESQGHILRGQFRSEVRQEKASSPSHEHVHPSEHLEWCDRRLLARIHRRTITILRQEVEAVSASDFMRFLLRWQHVSPSARLHGESGLRQVLEQLAGFEAAAAAWEPYLLASRLMDYRGDYLDYLCLRGTITWGRLSPPHIEENRSGLPWKSRLIPTTMAPISLFPRDRTTWLLSLARKEFAVRYALLPEKLGPVAQATFHYLTSRGASFFTDIVRETGHLQAEVEQGLWELTSAGLVTADGFDNLRALLDPHRRRGEGRNRNRRPRHTIGRWTLLEETPLKKEAEDSGSSLTQTECLARQLLARYGIVFRDLLKRESICLPWRDLLIQYRRLEWQGEIRGGRFVAGFSGEQFGLAEAVDALRALRRSPQPDEQDIRLTGSDPLNLAGIILPGPKIPALPNNLFLVKNGEIIHEIEPTPV